MTESEFGRRNSYPPNIAKTLEGLELSIRVTGVAGAATDPMDEGEEREEEESLL